MEIEPLEPDCFYHVYNRGINRQPFLTEESHFIKFMSLCKKYLPRIADVYAYCLLPNHFHFLLYIRVYPDRVSLPPCQGISHLCNSYAQWFNRRSDRVGGLFQRPFRRKKITDQDYLKQVIYYIHRNPLHHNLTGNPVNYRFSSYREFISDQPTILQREQVLEWFDGRENFIHFHSSQFNHFTISVLEDE